MNTSSAQESYSITSIDTTDTITISSSFHTSSANTITLTVPPNISSIGGGLSYVSGSGISGATVGGISSGSINWSYNQEEFVNCFPSYEKIQSMCKEYPGLKIAYEKFVTTYRLVKDDYDTPKDQRAKP